MGLFAEIVKLGASKLNALTGGAQWQAINALSNDVSDFEDFGEIDVFQCLGVDSLPWPADESGHVEALILRGAGNRNAVCVGARELRTAKGTGNLKPGDTVLRSTGPQQAAQVQCKEEKRQVVLYTKDTAAEGMVIMLDGKNDKLQINARGAVIEIDPDGDISLTNAAGTGFAIQGKKIVFLGELSIPGIPPGMALLAGLPAPDPTGLAPTMPVLGTSK